jgi:predicted ATPase/class 3 adenylate cyclase
MSDLPTGTVTFLFTDIEGSTRLLHELGDRYGQLLNEHHRILREVLTEHAGVEIGTEGDAFFVAFPKVIDAVHAAAGMQRALADYRTQSSIDLRVRMGMHTGEAQLVGDNYGGLDVHRAARIAAAAHGEQVLLSATTANHVQGSASLAPGVRLLEIGRFQLKDLAEPELLFQLCVDGLRADFPDPAGARGNPLHLPPRLDEFVEREREMREINELVSAHRLVTLTGPGGTGKTRLAIEVARSMVADFPDGIYFVGLAAIVDPALVPSTIAVTLSLREEGARPVIETVKDYLVSKRVLLLLDNFEQVDESAPSISELLRAIEGLKFIVTSRAPLKLTGEHEYLVPPMSLPDPQHLPKLDALTGYESMTLFLQRARSVKPDFAITEDNAAVVAEICARLDGLPLAIELAAARARLLSPAEILNRLDRSLTLLSGASRDVPQRQRTLMDAIGWSYDLLDSDHQALFRRLGVFTGGWTLEAAEAIVDPDRDLAIDPIDGLEQLVISSLVRVWQPLDETRFVLLQTIREFALRTLEDMNELDDLRSRHATYFADLTRRAEAEIFSDDQDWPDRLELEHDNLRAALQCSIDTGDTNAGLSMATRLWRFWQIRSHLAEGRDWLTELLALPDEGGDRAIRAGALNALGGITYWQNDFKTTRVHYEAALEIFESISDRSGTAETLYNLGFVHLIEKDSRTSRALHERSLAIYAELGDEVNVAFSKWGLAMADLQDREFDEARRLGLEILDTFERERNWWGRTLGEFIMLQVNRHEGRYDDALQMLRESIGRRETQLDISSLSSLVELMADTEIAVGNNRRGLTLAAAASSLRREYGGGAPAPLLDLQDPRELMTGKMPVSEIESIWQEGEQLAPDEIVAYAQKASGDDE